MSTESSTLLEQRVAALVNSERREAGLDDVKLELHLNASAQEHADWMAETGNFSHEGEGGSNVTDRAEDADFPLEGDWRVSENLAWISTSGPLDAGEIDGMHQALMNSDSHRDNILDPDVSYIGVGLSTGTREVDGVEHDAVYLSQTFAETEGDVQVENVAPEALALEGNKDLDDILAPTDPMSGETGSGDAEDGSSDDSSCFIATAAYGDPNHPDVVALRSFRDRVLVNGHLGKIFIRIYWKIGPVLARMVTHNAVSGWISRGAIAPAVRAVRNHRMRRVSVL